MMRRGKELQKGGTLGASKFAAETDHWLQVKTLSRKRRSEVWGRSPKDSRKMGERP